MAAWMATEFWADFRDDIAITITPVKDGRVEVYLNGEKVFDRKQEGGKYPDMKKVREIKTKIMERLPMG